MKEFLNSHFAVTIIILVLSAFTAFWGFLQETPAVKPNQFQKKSKLIGTVAILIIIAVGAMTIKRLFGVK